MLKYYYRIKIYMVGITALLLLPAVAAFASPPDSSDTQLLKPMSISLKRIKSSLNLMQSNAMAKLEEKEIADPSGLFSKFLSGLQTGGYYRANFWGRSMP